MQAISAKELEYIVDSMSNEELLLKQCAAAASITANPAVRSQCLSQLQTHEQHLHTLMNVLHSASTQAQSGNQQQANMQQH